VFRAGYRRRLRRFELESQEAMLAGVAAVWKYGQHAENVFPDAATMRSVRLIAIALRTNHNLIYGYSNSLAPEIELLFPELIPGRHGPRHLFPTG
jgi:hypothetical protein